MKFFHRLRSQFRKQELDQDLSDELAFHIEQETEENIAAGMGAEEARYAAIRKFGGVEQVKEECRDAWGFHFIETLLQDLRFGWRMLAKNPGFTAVAVLTLALGIGVNITIFTLVDAMVLRPMPVYNQVRLVVLGVKSSQGIDAELSYPDYEDLRQQVKSFSGLAIYHRVGRFLNSLDESDQVLVDQVTPDYFKVLGVHPLLGRVFSPELDGNSQSGLGVVVSYRLWRGRLGGDPAIIGKEIKLTGNIATVIGVAPPHFQGLNKIVPTDIWLPDLKAAQSLKRSDRWFESVARLKEGVTPAQATAELEGISQRLASLYPETNRGKSFQFSPLVSGERKTWIIALAAMVLPGLVLLIACANLAGLLLARAETRRHELAMRVALGAGPWRLARQLLTEGLLLSAAGGSLAFILTVWLMSFQRALMPAGYSFIGPDMQIDFHQVIFAASVSILATLIFTLTPILHAWKSGLGTVMKSKQAVTASSSRRPSARDFLVGGQMAVSVVVMTLSLLFLRSLNHVRSLPVGFDTHKKLAVVNVFALRGMPTSQLLPALAERVAGLPGVKRTTYAMRMMLSGSGGGMNVQVSIPGYALPEGQPSIPINLNAVGPNYFETIGTHILQGRGFTSADGPESQKVVIVSQSTARRFWRHEDALGKSIKINKLDTLIVGIAEDAKIEAILEAPKPYLYLPFGQTQHGEGAIIVESSAEPEQVMPVLRREIHGFSPSTVIWGVYTTKSLLDLSTLDLIVESWLIGILSLVGVLLAAMGLYGVIAYIVRSRTQEIGIRLALGAGLRHVQGIFVLRGLKLALVGVLAGLLAAIVAGHLAAGLLYEVKSYDPWALAVSAIGTALIALLACYIPARRATKVDPMVALRHE